MSQDRIPRLLSEKELKEKLSSPDLKIQHAGCDEIEALWGKVDEFLKILGKYMRWDDTASVFVSDRSQLGDFHLEDDQIEQLSKELGFTVNHEYYIKDIAAMMQPKN